MPRGPAPAWTRRKEPVLDHLVVASVERAGGKHHPETGAYSELVYAGCATRERASEIKRALFRAAKHTGYSMNARVVKNGSEFDVHFTAHDKALAKAHVLAKYGADRSKWPYDPRRKGAA